MRKRLVSVFFAITFCLPATHAWSGQADEIAPASAKSTLPLADLRRFAEVFDRIKKSLCRAGAR